MNMTELLLEAFTLLGLGMTFVFLFLGLLMLAVNLMAKYLSAEEPVNSVSNMPSAVQQGAIIEPKLVAAITTAVQQYRKTK